ncbi:hypothetical protein Cpir12675_005713 [Ceratocystis pirilliformis]|uniref:Catechol 1 2-dioxygenase n=1 Tax=Ceratocystis pirilliformis TaxID=259994 RepID=A0ABR3YNJ9_9PEZI
MSTETITLTAAPTHDEAPEAGRSRMDRWDPTFTKRVLSTMGPNMTPRNRELMGSLISHLHDFAREVELTNDEWMAGVQFINYIGTITTPTRNEAHRISDILGLESLVDEIAHKVISDTGIDPTSSSILGPFWSPHAPFRDLGSSIIVNPNPDGRVIKMWGKITDLTTGKGIPNAVFDIWQASANGKYDFQDPENQTPNNLRGKFRADAEGNYSLYCYYPTAYSLPSDGPAYKLVQLMDRHTMRPAHIHIMVTHPEFKGCTTQLYPKDDPWLVTDTVFAVKDDLVVNFPALEGDDKAKLQLHFDVVLAPKDYKGKEFLDKKVGKA